MSDGRTSCPLWIRELVEKRDGPNCYRCNDPDGPFEWDHDRIPFKWRKGWDPNDTRKLCSPCHKKKTHFWDRPNIARINRLEKKRKGQTAKKKKTKWPSQKLRSAGFDKTLSRRMDGTTVRKQDK